MKQGDCAVMKKWNRIIIAAALIALTICAVRYIFNPERRIKSFVNQNSKELAAIAEAYLNSDTTTKIYKGVKVEQVFRGNHDIVSFITVDLELLQLLSIMAFIIRRTTSQQHIKM